MDPPGIHPRRADGDTLDGVHRELEETRAQFAATSLILRALGRSSADPGELLDTIVERALHLCGAQVSQIYLVEGDRFRLSRVVGAPDRFLSYVADHPISVSRTSLLGRVALDQRIQQIPDVLADREYGRQDLQRLAGYRTLMSAPMIVADRVVGVLSVWRTEVDPFDERAMEVLGAFAAQAAIVINTTHLVRTLETRSAELASKVEQLEALREVGEAVSSSLDLDQVLETIVMSAVRLTGTDGGSIMEYDADLHCFSVRSAYGTSAELTATLRAMRIPAPTSLVGRAALGGAHLELPDLAAVDVDEHLGLLRDDGWLSVLAVPMRRQGRLIGALVIRRRSTGGFSRETRELLDTLATQSALAIVNARLFRELRVKGAELEVASQHKSEFLASMSHELRTPLNAVIGFSEVLLDQMFGTVNPRQAEYLRDILNSGRHLLELLNEILDLSRVEAGQMRLDTDTFAVRNAVEYGLSLLRERAALHHIGLEMDVEPEDMQVEADELRVKQVLVNLLTNAVKFTPDGGRVRVSARREAGATAILVSDTGIGVPDEDRERIFESFQQGRRGLTKEEGTGLGLTLSRRIVDLMGGRLWLESEVGLGSTFGFTIPDRPAHPRAPQSQGSATTGPLIVVVDDDRASLDLVDAYLSGSGIKVVRAQDGVSGLETVRRCRPSAVVLDIRLPRLDGWQVLAALKSEPATAAVPVIIASIVDERHRGISMGAHDYLIKPMSRADFVSALDGAGIPVHPSSAWPGGGRP